MRKQTKMVLSLLLAALLTAPSAAVFADQPTTAGEIAEEQTAPPIDGTPVVVKLGDVFFDVPTGSELEKAVSKLKEAGVLDRSLLCLLWCKASDQALQHLPGRIPHIYRRQHSLLY